MCEFFRPALIIAVVLLVPLVPFFGFGRALESTIEKWFTPPPSQATTAIVVAGVLATDVFLPIPSSFVSTAAGAQLNPLVATAASWIGMTAGAVFGFIIARAFGRPLAERWSKSADLAQLEQLTLRWGPHMLVLTRALPLLAEASVLLTGAMQVPWRAFLWPVALSNLGIALAYSFLGHYAREYNAVTFGLAGSIALPLLAATIIRWWMPQPPAPLEIEHAAEQD